MTTLGWNLAFSAGKGLLGIRMDPYEGFNFFVEIQGLIIGGFTEVSGLSVETGVEDYREGGLNDRVHKIPGPGSYPQNLVLKRGITAIESLWKWHQDVMKGNIKRKNGTIYVLDNRRIPYVWWDFEKAYPIKWSGPDFRSDSPSIAVESVELVHQGIKKPTFSSVWSAGRAVVSAASDVF